MERRSVLGALALGGVIPLTGCLDGGIARALGMGGPEPRIIDYTSEERTYEKRDWVSESDENRATFIVEIINEGSPGGIQVLVETFDEDENRLGRFGQPVYLEEEEYVQVAVGGVMLDDVADFTVTAYADDSIGPSYAPNGGNCQLNEEGEPVGEDGQCPMGHYG